LWGLVSTEPLDRERGRSGLLRGAPEGEGVRDTGSRRCARGDRERERGAREEEGPVPMRMRGTARRPVCGWDGSERRQRHWIRPGWAAAGEVVLLDRQLRRRGWAGQGFGWEHDEKLKTIFSP
jgi:hypothetical protein